MANGERNLRCGVTHLDHISMEERKIQLEHVVEELIPTDTETESNTDIILMGDLNALTRSDYCENDWKRIIVKAECNGWEVPGTDEDLDILKEMTFSTLWQPVITRRLSLGTLHPLAIQCTESIIASIKLHGSRPIQDSAASKRFFRPFSSFI